MPKSRVRKKAAYTPPPTRSARKRVSPPWVAPAMIACLLVGLAWLVVFYVSGGNLPVPQLKNGNLAVGFVFILGGLGLATQWR